MAEKKTKPAKGLGTGLGALFGADAVTLTSDFEYLPITKIEPRRDQPRTIFEQEPLEELASSIREHGVLSPITVRPLDGGFYQIIAGERRWRASRLAELTEVPARILNVNDRTAMELSLIENLQREDLNPIEEALGYRALADEFDLTQEQIAQQMGKSRPAVANALRLLALPTELVGWIRDGDISAGTARALAPIGDTERILEAAQMCIRDGLSTREAERLAARIASQADDLDAKSEKSQSRAQAINYVTEFEQSLSQTYGRKVKIVGGTRKKGRIEIEFYGDDDFAQLISLLERRG